MRIDYFLEQFSSRNVEWFEHTNGGFAAEIPSEGGGTLQVISLGERTRP